MFVEGEIHGPPIGTVEDGGGLDVEEDHSVAGAEVILDSPLDGRGGFVA